jgi:biopolymer transport protein ExbD
MTRISLTPVIDVVFILLIFFMLASNFNKIGELKMDVTKESSQATNQDIKLFKLKVRQDNSVLSNGKVYEDKDLLSMLKLATKEESEYVVVITANKDVTYQRYFSIMSFLKDNEIENITIGITDNEVKN